MLMKKKTMKSLLFADFWPDTMMMFFCLFWGGWGGWRGGQARKKKKGNGWNGMTTCITSSVLFPPASRLSSVVVQCTDGRAFGLLSGCEQSHIRFLARLALLSPPPSPFCTWIGTWSDASRGHSYDLDFFDPTKEQRQQKKKSWTKEAESLGPLFFSPLFFHILSWCICLPFLCFAHSQVERKDDRSGRRRFLSLFFQRVRMSRPRTGGKKERKKQKKLFNTSERSRRYITTLPSSASFFFFFFLCSSTDLHRLRFR